MDHAGKWTQVPTIAIALACGSVGDESDNLANAVSDASGDQGASPDAPYDGGASFAGFTFVDASPSPQMCTPGVEDGSCGPSCSAREEEAESLVDSFVSCGSDADCTIADMDALAGANNCIGAFQCWQALRADAVNAFRSAALDLVQRYAGCGDCSTEGQCIRTCVAAECIDPRDFEARCIAGSCQAGVTTRACEMVQCLRAYECVTSCDAAPSYVGCCPCEPPTFDRIGCDADAGR